MKEESARSSPELAPESLTQRRQQPVPVHYVSLQSENSAFDRVVSKAVSSARQQTRGYSRPADPVHTAKLVASEIPENVSEYSWVGSVTQNIIKPSTLTTLESERRDIPLLHSSESKADDKDAPFTEPLEKSRKTLSSLENHGLSRSHQDPSGNEDFGKPAVSSITLKQQKEAESLSQAQHQPTDRTGRSEMVVYVQREPVYQDSRTPGHRKETTMKKHKVLVRSLSDYTGPPQLQTLDCKDPASTQEPRSSQAEGLHTELGMLDTRVSVAQLRNTFLESASSTKKPKL